MEGLKFSVLGNIWHIYVKSAEADPKLKETSGYADPSTRSIIINDFADVRSSEYSIEALSVYRRKVMRHEIIHAFLFESGFDGEESGTDHWAENEKMVEWIALQLPKIVEACQEVGCI